MTPTRISLHYDCQTTVFHLHQFLGIYELAFFCRNLPFSAFSYVCADSSIFILFSELYSAIFIIYFDAHRVPDLARECLCCLVLKVPLSPLFLGTFLLSGTSKCSRLILYSPCPSPGISQLSKEPWLLLMEDDI